MASQHSSSNFKQGVLSFLMGMQEGIFPVNAISPDHADKDIAEILKQKIERFKTFFLSGTGLSYIELEMKVVTQKDGYFLRITLQLQAEA